MMQHIDFKFIEAIKGVAQFIVIDADGRIVEEKMERPRIMADLIQTCCKHFQFIGKEKFRYALFRQKDTRDLIMLPVGDYTIGVMKQKGMNSSTIIEAVHDFADAFRIRH